MHTQGQSRPYADSQPFRIEEVALEGPGPGEVLVEIRGAGLCHSDMSVIPRHVDMYLRARPPVEHLRSDHIGFGQLNSAFDALHAGQVIRQILLPHGTV